MISRPRLEDTSHIYTIYQILWVPDQQYTNTKDQDTVFQFFAEAAPKGQCWLNTEGLQGVGWV